MSLVVDNGLGQNIYMLEPHEITNILFVSAAHMLLR